MRKPMSKPLRTENNLSRSSPAEYNKNFPWKSNTKQHQSQTKTRLRLERLAVIMILDKALSTAAKEQTGQRDVFLVKKIYM